MDGELIDCKATPLPNPAFEIDGAQMPESGPLRLTGEVDRIIQTDGHVELALIDEQSRSITVRMDLVRPIRVDLLQGTVVDLDYWRRQGFEGTAHGIRIRDDLGLVLVADDGDYGNAIPEEDFTPFTVAQTDAGCRNRENRPGDLNNFPLVVSSGQDSVQLIHGETGNLTSSLGNYTILVTRSVARVDDAIWTDAPHEFTSFVIARAPTE